MPLEENIQDEVLDEEALDDAEVLDEVTTEDVDSVEE